jgi:hypothetical protein
MAESWHPKKYVIYCACLIVIIEATAYFVGMYLCKKQMLYCNHVNENYETYISRRHPVLGWTSTKPIFIFPDQSGPGTEFHTPYLSIYGAAFFVNENIDPDYRLDRTLANLLVCQVANYGVGGYGTDQSYLTFHYNRQDNAKLVMLGFSSDHIRWNVNRLRNLLAPSTKLNLKPRFIINEKSELQLLTLPAVTDKSFYQISANPEKYLEHEFFLPGELSGIYNFHFPYVICLLRAIKFRFPRLIKNKYPYEEFYHPDHPAQALLITASIMELFFKEGKAQGRRPYIVLIPRVHDLEEFQKKRAWIYQPLIDQLEQRRVAYFNLGPEIINSLGNRRPSEIAQKTGSYNNEGQKLLGSILFNFISSLKISSK